MPEKKKRRLTTVCTICNGPSASHLHYGAIACYSCRAFFRRGIGKSYCCVEGTGDCTIDWTNRRSCQWCRFDRCLKAGMKPELVDAAFRRKSNHRRLTAAAAFDEPVLFDNFKSLEKDDLLDFFQDISCGDNQPLMAPMVAGESINNFDAGNIYFLESEATEIFNLNYNNTVPSSSSPTYSLSPPSSSSSSYSLSPPSSSSSYSSSLSPSSYSDYSDINEMSTMAADGTYTININITDIENQIFNLPESVYQTTQPTEPELNRLENSFTAMNTVDKDAINNHDDDDGEESDDSDDVNNSFNIEALVDECFLNHSISGSAASDKQLISQS